MTIGDLLVGLFTFFMAYFTAKRSPGAIEGVFTSPEIQTVTKLTLTQTPTVEVKADAAKAAVKASK